MQRSIIDFFKKGQLPSQTTTTTDKGEKRKDEDEGERKDPPKKPPSFLLDMPVYKGFIEDMVVGKRQYQMEEIEEIGRLWKEGNPRIKWSQTSQYGKGRGLQKRSKQWRMVGHIHIKSEETGAWKQTSFLYCLQENCHSVLVNDKSALCVHFKFNRNHIWIPHYHALDNFNENCITRGKHLLETLILGNEIQDDEGMYFNYLLLDGSVINDMNDFLQDVNYVGESVASHSARCFGHFVDAATGRTDNKAKTDRINRSWRNGLKPGFLILSLLDKPVSQKLAMYMELLMIQAMGHDVTNIQCDSRKIREELSYFTADDMKHLGSYFIYIAFLRRTDYIPVPDKIIRSLYPALKEGNHQEREEKFRAELRQKNIKRHDMRKGGEDSVD